MKAAIRYWKDNEPLLEVTAETDDERESLTKFANAGFKTGYAFNGATDGCGKTTVWLRPEKD